MRLARVVAIGVAVWAAVGAAVGGLLAIALGSVSNGFAVTGIVLTVGAIAWAAGPFKAPMTWSEGALMAYQGNAEMPAGVARPSRWRLVAVPVCACGGGALLLTAAAVLAAAR